MSPVLRMGFTEFAGERVFWPGDADAAERLAVATSAVAQADESAALTRARFEKQAVLTADTIGAESRLIEARLRRTFAAADERLAIVELRRALGLNPLP